MYTPLECEYWPVRMLARLGQQSGLETYPRSNEMPWPASSDTTVGIAETVSQRWSSVRISTTLGGSFRSIGAPEAAA